MRRTYCITAALLAALLMMPAAAFAENGCPSGQTPGAVDGTSACVPISSRSGGGASESVELPNPLGPDRASIPAIVGGLLRAVFGVLGAIALLMFLYGGFMWLISGGNADKIETGRNTMIWAALGIAVIFASYAIADFVITAITGATK